MTVSPNAKNLAMLKMAGEIISDLNSGYGQCTVFDGQKLWKADTEAFLNNGLGNFFITFDPVFQLAMADTDCGTLRQDAPGEINAAFCIAAFFGEPA